MNNMMNWNLFGTAEDTTPEFLRSLVKYDHKILRKTLAQKLIFEIKDYRPLPQIHIPGYTWGLTGLSFWTELLRELNSGNSTCGTCGNCNTCFSKVAKETICTYCIVCKVEEPEVIEVTAREISNHLLKEVPEPEPPVDFMYRLKNSIETQIVDNRIEAIGKDPEISFTNMEYYRAYDHLLVRKWEAERAHMLKMNIGILGFSAIMGMSSENPGIYWGIFISSLANYYRVITYKIRKSGIEPEDLHL